MCDPAPCSRSAAAEAAKQLAELETALAADARFGEMVRLAGQTPPAGLMYVADASLFARKLIGQCGTAKAALEQIELSREWRSYHRVDEILLHQVPGTFVRKARSVFPHGLHKTDAWGHPLYIECVGQIVPAEMGALWALGTSNLPPSALPPAGPPPAIAARQGKVFAQRPNATLWYHFQLVDFARLTYAAPRAQGQRRASKMVTILDLSGLRLGLFTSKACLDRLGLLAKLGDMLVVENLAAIYVVNAPWFFAKGWQAVSHLLVPRTAEKLRILTPAETGPFLRKMVPPENLPAFLGGDCTCGEDGCVSSSSGLPSAALRDLDERVRGWSAEFASARLLAEASEAKEVKGVTHPAAEIRLAPRGRGNAPLVAWLRSLVCSACFRPSSAARSPASSPSWPPARTALCDEEQELATKPTSPNLTPQSDGRSSCAHAASPARSAARWSAGASTPRALMGAGRPHGPAASSGRDVSSAGLSAEVSIAIPAQQLGEPPRGYADTPARQPRSNDEWASPPFSCFSATTHQTEYG